MKPIIVVGAPLSGHKLLYYCIVEALKASGIMAVDGDEITNKTPAGGMVYSQTVTSISDKEWRTDLLDPLKYTTFLCKRDIRDLGVAYSFEGECSPGYLQRVIDVQTVMTIHALHTVKYEELRSEPESTVDKACERIGLRLLDFLWIAEEAIKRYPQSSLRCMQPDLFSSISDLDKSKIEEMIK